MTNPNKNKRNSVLKIIQKIDDTIKIDKSILRPILKERFVWSDKFIY